MQFNLGVYAHPIYVNGDYPEIMKTKVAEKSASQNYSKSRLPVFTETEKKMIKGYCFITGFVTRLARWMLMCIFCRSLFVLLEFSFWPLCCLFLRFTDSDYPPPPPPLVSSNSNSSWSYWAY